MGDKSLIIFLISSGQWKPCPTHGMLVGDWNMNGLPSGYD